MKVGIIGGTGGMGKGFAIRWCKDHNILIGSRDAERANTSAQEYTQLTKEAYEKINGDITGTDNTTVAKESDVLVLSIPYEILIQFVQNYYLTLVMTALLYHQLFL